MFCQRCGKSLSPESLFCNGCGASVRAGNEATEASTALAQPQASPLANIEVKAMDKTVQGEQVIFRIRPAFYSVSIAYAMAALASLLAAGVIGRLVATGVINNSGKPWLGMFICAVIFFCFPFYRHIRRNRVTYTLTNAKIEIEYGLIAKTIRNIPLRNIQDVTTTATVSERLIGIGDVIIDSAAEAGRIPMRNIRDPRKYADLILNQLHRWN
jgi:membrane protein YdbS with pleckstrin-like domain